MKFQNAKILLTGLVLLMHMGLSASTLQIYPAVELEFATQPGQHYQIEASGTLEDWASFGSLIEGTGTDFHLLVSARESGMRFFRLIDVDVSQGLVARYRCDGNALDSSTNRNHGLPSGVIWTTNRFGSLNAAARFSGTFESFIRVPDAPSLDITSAITVAAWVNFDVGGSEHPRILHKHAYELFTYEAGDPTRRPAFQCLNIGLVATDTPVLSEGRWTFLAATYDGSEMKLYVDGTLATSVTGPPASIPTNGLDVNIGRNAQNFSDNYKGIIDDVRLYNRALSAAEILQLFNEMD